MKPWEYPPPANPARVHPYNATGGVRPSRSQQVPQVQTRWKSWPRRAFHIAATGTVALRCFSASEHGSNVRCAPPALPPSRPPGQTFACQMPRNRLKPTGNETRSTKPRLARPNRMLAESLLGRETIPCHSSSQRIMGHCRCLSRRVLLAWFCRCQVRFYFRGHRGRFAHCDSARFCIWIDCVSSVRCCSRRCLDPLGHIVPQAMDAAGLDRSVCARRHFGAPRHAYLWRLYGTGSQG
jgi:hypothetical protein